mgnify:FL=1|tara:strand:- start:923 stop:1801 length:879 start_codon:yes stop_codon:yes gene_type:complete
MLANISRTSIASSYPNADGSWESAYCWHFTPGQYILHELSDGSLHYPGANDMTIAFWWKNPDVSSIGNYNFSGTPITLNHGNFTPLMGLGGFNANNQFIRFIPVSTGNHRNIYGTSGTPYWQNIDNDDCPFGTDLWDDWIFTTITYEHGVGHSYKHFIMNYCYDTNLVSGSLSTLSLSDHLGAPYKVRIGGEGVEFYIRELGIWHTKLDSNNQLALFNNKTPIDFKTNVGNYDQSSALKAYWRFGDGTGDNPANHLNDEEDDGSTINMDLTGVGSFYGTIVQLPVGNVGNTE